MDWKSEIRRRLSNLDLEPTRENEIIEELAQHLDDHYKEAIARGCSPSEAQTSALSELTGSELLKRELARIERHYPSNPVVLGQGRKNMIEDVWQDLRYGARSLRKNPSFTLIALVTLALGIGANTAIFSVVNAVLLKPLPYPDPQKLAMVYSTTPQAGNGKVPLCDADFVDWKNQNQIFENVAAFTSTRFSYSGGESPERLGGAWVTADFFSTIGVQPAMGRGFLAGEDDMNNPYLVVVSDGFWKRNLGASRDILEKQITLNARPFTIVGVMPPGFSFPEKDTELWAADGLNTTRRGPYYLWGLGRLKPNATIEQAKTEMDVIAHRVQEQIHRPSSDWTWSSILLSERIVGDVRPALLVLLAAVVFVLLIACANIANLLLARATGREREISIRVALGASRGRLVRQLLTESLLLAGLGAAAGLPIAYFGVRLLIAVSPPDFPRLQEIGIDGRVLGMTMLIAVACGFVFGLVPSLQSSRLNLSQALKEGARGTDGSGRRRVRSALVVAEIAFSLVLLVGAGLMVKSFVKLQNVSPGFNPDRILTLHLTLPRARYDTNAKINTYNDQLIERINSVRGVEAAGLSISIPPNNLEISDSFSIEGRPTPAGATEDFVPILMVSPEYFTALGVPILRGRGFAATDKEGAPPVVIINQTLADRYFSGEDPVGHRLKVGGVDRPKNVWMEIVGVVSDVTYTGLDGRPSSAYYVPLAQNAWGAAYLVIRSSVSPTTLTAAIREQIWELDKDIPIANLATMDQLLSESVAQPRFRTVLVGIFAGLALVLASVGIYGVISYSVTQRIHEIGIRMALGAQTRNVSALVVREGLTLAIVGVAVGLGVSLVLTRLIETLLFEVSTTDRAVFAGVSMLLIVIAVLACWVPAVRAARIDPIAALRQE